MAQSSSAQRDPSMEEILASIRKIIEEGDDQGSREQREGYEPTAIGPAANDTVKSATVQPAHNRDAPADLDTAPLSDVEEDLVLANFRLDLSDAGIEEGAPNDMSARNVLISDAPRRQVAASFSELTEALAHNRRRSLDEVAEEVLRPMLQDWLDNNLPTLVERLVREEIERVARGA